MAFCFAVQHLPLYFMFVIVSFQQLQIFCCSKTYFFPSFSSLKYFFAVSNISQIFHCNSVFSFAVLDSSQKEVDDMEDDLFSIHSISSSQPPPQPPSSPPPPPPPPPAPPTRASILQFSTSPPRTIHSSCTSSPRPSNHPAPHFPGPFTLPSPSPPPDQKPSTLPTLSLPPDPGPSNL